MQWKVPYLSFWEEDILLSDPFNYREQSPTADIDVSIYKQ